MAEPVVIATWPFGKTAVEAALKLLLAGKAPLDAALAGAQAVEDDPTESTSNKGPSIAALRVLVAEDDEVNQLVIRSMLAEV